MSEEEEPEINELGEDDFSNEKDWEQVRPLELYIDDEVGDDGMFNIYYMDKEGEPQVCSEIKEDDIDSDGNIEDLMYIMFPFFHKIDHKREVVPIEANYLVGYWGANVKKKDATIFAFPLFWNGTINVGERGGKREFMYNFGGKNIYTGGDPELEKIDTTIDLTKPVGYFIVELDLGGEEVSIEDYDIDDRLNVVRGAVTNDSYKLKFNKTTNVDKEIMDKFIIPTEKSNQEGVVRTLTEEGRLSLKKNRKNFIALFNRLKEKLDTISKKPKIRSRDLKEVKDELPKLMYDEIRDYDINPNSVEDIKSVEKLKSKFNKVLAKYREQQETQTNISEVSAPETIIEQPIEQPVRQVLPTIPEERELGNVAQKVADIEELLVLQKNIDDLEAEIKAESSEIKKKILIRALGALVRKQMTLKAGRGINNPKLYEKAKEIADEKYKKPSAYKSGFIIKKYKELGGTYSGDKPKTTGIARWFKEEWKDIGNKEYPVYRPTKRITIETPLTPEEIKPSNLMKQIKLKQEIKGDANLPPFEKKGTGKVIPVGIALDKITPYDEIWKYSNPKKVAEMAEKYLGKDDAKFVFRSSNPKKKYMVYDKKNEKWVYFGEMGYEDFTKHQDDKRRKNYLTRTANMKGDWKDNKYSANNLSRNILW